MLLRFVGSTFGAFGDQMVANMSSKIDAKTGIEKSTIRGGPSARQYCQEGGNGGQEVRKKGKKEEKKKESKKVRTKGRCVERQGALHARPGGSAEFTIRSQF